MIKIGVGNQKGGVGKTTTAVALGHGLVIAGYRVLIIDMDSQGHVATFLGKDKQPGLYEFVVGKNPLREVAVKARTNLLVIPGDKSSERVTTYLKDTPFGEKTIAKRLEEDVDINKIDVVIFDMAPSFDQKHIATLFATDLVIIPTKCEQASLDGVKELLLTVKQVQAYDHKLDFRILPTFYDQVRREVRIQYENILETFPGRTWAPIPVSTEVSESVALGKTVWEYCPTVKAVMGYPGEEHRNIYKGGYTNLLGRVQNYLEENSY